MKLWQKVIIAMLLGILTGYILGEHVSFLKYIGDLFINMIKMVVIPLVFFSILNGITTLDDTETFSRLGLRALLAYSFTTMFAVVIGLCFANLFQPGIGLDISLEVDMAAEAAKSHHTITDILLDIIPKNPINAMATGNTVQVVVFAMFTGFALILIGEEGREVRRFVNSATTLVLKMMELVIQLTPYGVFALMSWAVGTHGLGLMLSLLKFILVVIGALFAQYILFGIMILVFARLNPFVFYKKMLVTQALAFATVSSKATLPTAMSELRNRCGVSKQSASFILPLGTSMNMDGVAIYLGICSVFFAQLTGMELTWTHYATIILTSTIGSIGAAGFPGGSMVMMGMVLSSVGLPLSGISLILGVDRFLEMLRTVINITGDCTVTLIVDKMEGTLDEKIYYTNNKQIIGKKDEKI